MASLDTAHSETDRPDAEPARDHTGGRGIVQFLTYAARRLVYAVVVIWVAATLVFLFVHLAPGDPISYIVGRLTQAGTAFSDGPALIEQYRAQFGLDQPLWNQYLAYLGQLVTFNLGFSIPNFPATVIELIGRALPYTLGLLLTSTLIAFVLGSLFGALMAWRPDSSAARFVMPSFLIIAAIPVYLIGLGLLYLFAFQLHWLPVGGATSLIGPESGFGGLLDLLRHAFLPGLAVVLSATGFWMLSMRSAMIPVMGSDYLLLAEAKGLTRRRVFFRYALRNALLPQVTGLAIALGNAVAGQVLVEVVFAYPGLGTLLLNAVNERDYPVIQGISLILVTTVTLGVLVVDLLYPRIDPRISYERQ